MPNSDGKVANRKYQLDARTVIIPKGTRVVLKVDVNGDHFIHKASTSAVVREVTHHTYELETPSGRRFHAQRDQITVQKEDLLADLGERQWTYNKLRDEVIYSAVVGSKAWNLDTPDSDEDVRGCFVAPFEESSGLWMMPETLQDPLGEAAYWEVAKFIEQGLRGDANTLETLWSPHHKTVTALGEQLIAQRDMFVSMNILGSFGRYAQSQFKKMERSLTRDNIVRALIDDIDAGRVDSPSAAYSRLHSEGFLKSEKEAQIELQAIYRSLFDRGLLESTNFEALQDAVHNYGVNQIKPSTYRPKNAYNLLRLLHSCVHWLKDGKPIIAVHEPLRSRLMSIKNQEVAIETIIEEAKQIADTLESIAESSVLPQQPNYAAADEFLKLCRREQARRVFNLPSGLPSASSPTSLSNSANELLPDDWTVSLLPTPLPPDVNPGSLKRFLEVYSTPHSVHYTPMLWVSLTGAHAYGFPSPDSDLDLKGIFVFPARKFLEVDSPKLNTDFLGDWEGREFDLTLNELGQCARLLLGGNGNLVERCLGPFQVVTTPLGRTFADLARESLSKRVARHYNGFFKGMRRESEIEAQSQGRTAKRLLYAYRVPLTGIHLLQTGEVVTNVQQLADIYGFKYVYELIKIKEERELKTLSEDKAAPALLDFKKLETMLNQALERSILPDAPPNIAQVNAFIVEQRLRLPGG